jgi:hypothetical protein
MGTLLNLEWIRAPPREQGFCTFQKWRDIGVVLKLWQAGFNSMRCLRMNL